jgi:hypothetical protein
MRKTVGAEDTTPMIDNQPQSGELPRVFYCLGRRDWTAMAFPGVETLKWRKDARLNAILLYSHTVSAPSPQRTGR